MNAHQRRLRDRSTGVRPRCTSCDRRLTESPCANDHGGLCCDCVDELVAGPTARLAPRLTNPPRESA